MARKLGKSHRTRAKDKLSEMAQLSSPRYKLSRPDRNLNVTVRTATKNTPLLQPTNGLAWDLTLIKINILV